MRFWDASAVISLCVSDPSTAIVRRLAHEDEAIAAWWGTIVECYSALSRLRRQGDLTTSDVARARRLLDRLAESWSEVAPTPRSETRPSACLGFTRSERRMLCSWPPRLCGPIDARGVTPSCAWTLAFAKRRTPRASLCSRSDPSVPAALEFLR